MQSCPDLKTRTVELPHFQEIAGGFSTTRKFFHPKFAETSSGCRKTSRLLLLLLLLSSTASWRGGEL